MRVGVPRELKDHEHCVAITPAGVLELTRHGHEVLIEAGAGNGSSITDQEYVAVGATIPEAFITLYWLERACQAQVAAMQTEIRVPKKETIETTNSRYKPGQRRRMNHRRRPPSVRRRAARRAPLPAR